jgi:hypothetical protein
MDDTLAKPAANVRSPLPYVPDRIRRWSIVALALATFSCIALPIVAFALRPAPIRSHEDQITQVLRQHGIIATAVRLGERWPDRINIQYGANVYPYGYKISVSLANGLQESGWLECAQRETKCTLTMLGLGLPKTPLPEFTNESALPIPTWLQPYLSRILP